MVAISSLDQLLSGFAARLNDLLRIASQEDLSDCFLVVRRLCVWEVPWRVVCFAQGKVLLCDDPSRYALRRLARCMRRSSKCTYRSQHCIHEFVGLVRLHEVPDFQDPNSQTWYDGGMFLQSLLQHFAIPVVVFDRSNFGYAPKALKSLEVRFVDVGEVWIRNDHVRQGLDITQTVGKSGRFSGCHDVKPELQHTLSVARVDSSWLSRSNETRSKSFQRRSTGASL